MRQSHTAPCVVLLSALIALTPAFAFGGKKKNSANESKTKLESPAPKQTSGSATTPNLDDILSQPVPRAPLQGSVEEKSEPAEGTPLQGGAMDGGGAPRLNGNAQDGGAVGGVPLQPKIDASTLLKGNASLTGGKAGLQDDPDREDKELMVEWDRWRNKFLRAVQLQVQAGVNHPDDWEEESRPRVVVDPYTGRPMVMPRFPMGTEAWFSCDVTNERKVKNLKIVKPSGFPAYDKAVLEGVRALEGTSMLEYPHGSHRLVVSETAGIRTAQTSEYQYHHFGDVERVRQPQ